MKTRKNEYPVDQRIINRWSPRALSSDPITDEQIAKLFEATQQAHSLLKRSPWRFVYAKKGSVRWQEFFDLLNPFNQRWAEPAYVLLIVLSEKNEYVDVVRQNSLLTGAACQLLAVQAACLDLVVHAIEGFDYEQAAHLLNAPDYTIEVMFAIGKLGNKEYLPDYLQVREYPSGRKVLTDLVFKNLFNQKGVSDE
ncbi:nitroreductase family protein [bacterium]|nr:MAG: nitroreductase family protein [bacterium]